MTTRTVFIDSQLTDYQTLATQYNSDLFNVIFLQNDTEKNIQIQNYLTANNVSAEDINVVSASSSITGIFTPRVVFIDSGVANYQALIANLPASATAVLLSANGDGLQQIANYLANNSGVVGSIEIISNLDIVSHGGAGELQLGETTLNSSTLDAHADLLAEIGSHLAADGDILLYGCNVAEGDVGQTFIDKIADLTKADVAASTDLTGSAALGGNWTLETVNDGGTIETAAIVDLAYGDVLVTIGTGAGGLSTWNNSLNIDEQAPIAIIIDSNVNINSWGSGTGTSLMVNLSSANVGDQLTVKSTSGNSAISVLGSALTYTTAGGTLTPIGTIDSIFNGANGVALKINLNNAASATSVQLLARAIQFANISDAPPAGSRAITLTLDDNNLGTVSGSSASVSITPINDAPVLTGDLAALVDEGGSYSITTTDLGYTDADDTAVGVTFTVSLLTNGSVKVDGTTATSFTGADLAAGKVTFVHDGSETTAASFNVLVEDGNEDSSTPVASTFNLVVTPVNDAPTITSGLTATVLESQTIDLTSFILPGIKDVDSAYFELLLSSAGALTGTSTVGSPVDIIDGHIYYQATADKFDAITGNFSDTVTFYARDSSMAVSDGTITLTVNQGTTSTATVYLSNGNDNYLPKDTNDIIYSNNGDDSISGGLGKDKLDGGNGNGNDRLRGDDGNDTLIGNNGDDILIGGTGNDIVFGGRGNDILRGDSDTLKLKGADTFVISKPSGSDTILDFNQGGGTYNPSEGDKLYVTADTGITSYSQIKSSEYTNLDGSFGTLISLGSGGQVSLVGVHASNISATLFEFSSGLPTGV